MRGFFFVLFCLIRGSGSGVGNVTAHLGWTRCLDSGKEQGARGSQYEDRSFMEKRGFGVMEGVFQRYKDRVRHRQRKHV